MGTNGLAHFKHVPLDLSKNQIRLVKVQSRTACSSDIRCTIETFDRDDPQMPPFEALSYVWGPSDHLRVIYLNSSPFNIRQNLWDFLYYASFEGITIWDYHKKRTVYQPGYLFIDQLCIDQASISEKNHQVRRMSEIYGGANLVVAWLGLGNEETQQDIDAIEMFGDGTADDFPPNEDMAIFNLPYWTRLWVVQEYILAKELIITCKDRGFHGDFLSSVLYDWDLKCLYFNLELSKGMQQAHALTNYGKFGRGDTEELGWILCTFSLLGCAMPQDRIFALIGLIAPQVRTKIVVDYSLSARDVFWVAFEEMDWASVHDSSWKALYELIHLMGVTRSECIERASHWATANGLKAKRMIEDKLQYDFILSVEESPKPHYGPG